MTGVKCRGSCDRYDLVFVKSSSYKDGKLKYCSKCEVFVKKTYEKCPCCNIRLRNKPKSTKDRRSKKGDIAFLFFDIDVSRTNRELQYLPKCYRFPELGARIIEHAFDYFEIAILQYEIMKTAERQRPDYLEAKYKILQRLKDKIMFKTKEYWKNVANLQ